MEPTNEVTDPPTETSSASPPVNNGSNQQAPPAPSENGSGNGDGNRPNNTNSSNEQMPPTGNEGGGSPTPAVSIPSSDEQDTASPPPTMIVIASPSAEDTVLSSDSTTDSNVPQNGNVQINGEIATSNFVLTLNNVPDNIMNDREMGKYAEVMSEFLNNQDELKGASVVVVSVNIWHQAMVVETKGRGGKKSPHSVTRDLQSDESLESLNSTIPIKKEEDVSKSIDVTTIIKTANSVLPKEVTDVLLLHVIESNQANLLDLFYAERLFFSYFKDIDGVSGKIIAQVTQAPTFAPTTLAQLLAANSTAVQLLVEEGSGGMGLMVWIGLIIGGLWCCLTLCSLSYLGKARREMNNNKMLRATSGKSKNKKDDPFCDPFLVGSEHTGESKLTGSNIYGEYHDEENGLMKDAEESESESEDDDIESVSEEESGDSSSDEDEADNKNKFNENKSESRDITGRRSSFKALITSVNKPSSLSRPKPSQSANLVEVSEDGNIESVSEEDSDDSSSDEDEADNKQKFNENKTERSKVSKEKKKPIAEKATSSRQLPSRSFSRSRDLIEKPKSAQQITSAKSSRHSSSAKSSPPPKSNSSSRINLTGKPNPSPHRKDDVRLMPEKAQSSRMVTSRKRHGSSRRHTHSAVVKSSRGTRESSLQKGQSTREGSDRKHSRSFRGGKASSSRQTSSGGVEMLFS